MNIVLPALSASFSLGPVFIHWYGLCLVVGIIAGYQIVRILNLKFKILNSNQFDSLFFHLVVWGFVGARLYHVFNEPQYYRHYPLDILKVWNGGLAIHGAILAGIFVVIYFSKKYADEKSEIRMSKVETISKFETQNSKQNTVIPAFEPESKQKQKNKKIFFSFFSFLDSCCSLPRTLIRGRNDGTVKNFFRLSDLLVIGLALGQATGRWGNYFNQELFGKPTSGFFRVFIDASHRPTGFENVAYYHPTFFYESLLNFGLFIILFVVYKHSHSVIPNLIWDPETKRSFSFFFWLFGSRVKARDDNQIVTGYRLETTGYTTCLYFIGYGLIRFFIDFLRIDPRPFFGGLYISQWVSLAMIVIGVGIWYTARKR